MDFFKQKKSIFQALKTTEILWAYKQHYVFLSEGK